MQAALEELFAADHIKPIICALHTGGRISEVLGLRWQDIDFKAH